jgi:hypothetical protein
MPPLRRPGTRAALHAELTPAFVRDAELIHPEDGKKVDRTIYWDRV